jgi:hypothetical protein
MRKRATNAEALAVDCPHCLAIVGARCVYPSGSTAKIHATRRWFAEHPAKPRPTPNPAPAKALAAKRIYNLGPRTRGSTALPGMVSYRIVATRRLAKGGMYVAVRASVDGAEAELVGVELAESEMEANGPDEKALRRAVVMAMGR